MAGFCDEHYVVIVTHLSIFRFMTCGQRDNLLQTLGFVLVHTSFRCSVWCTFDLNLVGFICECG